MEELPIYFRVILSIILIVWFLQVPIAIAINRDIEDPDLSTIKLLSWFGILGGITWIFALVLSLIYHPKNLIDKTASVENNSTSNKTTTDNFDLLIKLNELREKGIITQEEFEKQKEKFLSDVELDY